MAKQKTNAPNPAPKVGDDVEYIWPPGVEPLHLGGKTRPAKVLSVYEGFDGRLVDLDVDTGAGNLTVKSAPWRDAEDNAGNTWHQTE